MNRMIRGNRVIKGCVLVAGLLTMALSPLAQVSAAPFQGVTPKYHLWPGNNNFL